jgi:hypothetical protein
MKVIGFIVILTLASQLLSCSRNSREPHLAQASYTETDVLKFVTPGTPREAIIRQFGRPMSTLKSTVSADGIDYDETLFFMLPLPPADVKENLAFAGFQVRLKDGKAVRWFPTTRSIN